MKAAGTGGASAMRHPLLSGVCLLFVSVWLSGETPLLAATPWEILIRQAQAMGLPTRFLQDVPPSFVGFEFEDLRQFAAEYHPESHRMVLNRALSLNGAGGTLKPLIKLTAPELGTLYHELFHAYMDYLETQAGTEGSSESRHPLLAASREFRACRYGQVEITPVVSKKSIRESRYLTERESWEALNETWGVFVGWKIWNTVQDHKRKHPLKSEKSPGAWLIQLKKADGEGILVGYYEPQDPAERAKAPKRYLAPSFRISPREVSLLMEWIFERPGGDARQIKEAMGAAVGSERSEGVCPPAA